MTSERDEQNEEVGRAYVRQPEEMVAHLTWQISYCSQGHITLGVSHLSLQKYHLPYLFIFHSDKAFYKAA